MKGIDSIKILSLLIVHEAKGLLLSRRNGLLFLSFLLGLFLTVYSWYSSYPLSVNSVNDYVFNHISILYWLGLSLLLASMYLLAMTFKNEYLKWIMVAGIVIAMYSIFYFYYSLPTSDANFFRGLNEYFEETGNLNYSQPGKSYFQWPAIFLLSKIMTSVTGIELIYVEFIMFTVIVFLLATGLYLYASKAYRNSGYVAVVAFFIAMFYYLNVQFAAFTLAFSILILLFVLVAKPPTLGTSLMILILFIGITITHVYVPIFFIAFLLIRYLINRRRGYGLISLLTLTIYILYQTTLAQTHFVANIYAVISRGTEIAISSIVTFKPVATPIDSIAQRFSTFVFVSTILICLLGFVMILIRRKIRNLDIAIIVVGAGYFAVGTVLYLLGSRAIPLAFIPFSLGISYLFQSKFKSYMKGFFLVLIILFSFVPLHNAFYNNDLFFQTKEEHVAENFFASKYNFTASGLVLANYRVIDYFESRLPGISHFNRGLFANEDGLTLREFNALFYTIGFGWQTRGLNKSIGTIIDERSLNVVYSSGSCIVAIKP